MIEIIELLFALFGFCIFGAVLSLWIGVFLSRV